MKKQLAITFEEIIAQENLLLAWREFRRGKRKAKDVQNFERNLADNIIALHTDLASGVYRHGGYYRFHISDPKPRVIHKASVRDRLVHHAIHRKLYPLFDKTFIADSYSCRVDKGTHRALDKFKEYAHKLGQNNTRTVWVLKGDIRKFFDNIDHGILMGILRRQIAKVKNPSARKGGPPPLEKEELDASTIWLLEEVIGSFGAERYNSPQPPLILRGGDSKGLPLGNLTSQLLVNIYMNEFDQFVKHKLKVKYYIRYADDFVVLDCRRKQLEELILKMKRFLAEKLRLELHPDKLFIKTIASGVDFLGWVQFPNHRILRSAAKRRMMQTIAAKPKVAVIESYKGLLKHGKAYGAWREAENLYGLMREH